MYGKLGKKPDKKMMGTKKKMGKGVSGSIRYTLLASCGSDLTISPLSILLRSFPFRAGEERDGQLYHGDK